MRDPAVLFWPDEFGPRSMSITIDRPVWKGPKPLNGREQTVTSAAGGWIVAYEGVPIYRDRYRQFRPLWILATAFARPIYVKPEYTENMLARRNNIQPLASGFDPYGISKNDLTWSISALYWGASGSLAFGDEAAEYTSFEDGSFFIQSTGDCRLSASANRGAVQISVANSSVSPVEVGDYFEINGRVHTVTGIDGQLWNIWPSLRSNYAAGTVLEIDDPRLMAYMTAESRNQTMPTEARAISFMSLEFIEANW